MSDFLNVDDILTHLNLKDTMLACEFGCGSADFTMALAKKLSKGKVYAMDIQEEKLSALQSKLTLAKLNNVVMVLCDLEAPSGSTLPDNYLDVVLIPNMLFQTQNKYDIIKEGQRILKSGGQLLIVDWLKAGPFSPREGMVSPSQIKEIAKDLGLFFRKELASGDYHYALLFVK